MRPVGVRRPGMRSIGSWHLSMHWAMERVVRAQRWELPHNTAAQIPDNLYSHRAFSSLRPIDGASVVTIHVIMEVPRMIIRRIKPLVLSTAVSTVLMAAQAFAEDLPLLPPGAKPGECYTRIYVPPQYETKVEEIVVADGTEFVEVVPAEFKWVEKEVLVKGESEEIEVIPATFKTVTEEVVITPETAVLEVIPAEYETVEEKVLVREAYTTWKTGRGPIQKIDASTGEIMCLVEVPAEYKVVKRRKLVKPAETRTVIKPAESKTVERQVVDKPAETRVTKVPAEYVTVKVQELVAEARPERSPIPAELIEVERIMKVADGGLEWKQILCETNMTHEVVANIQDALKGQGIYRGPIDGSLGPMTMNAVRSFQKSRNLAAGQLTMETLSALDVKL